MRKSLLGSIAAIFILALLIFVWFLYEDNGKPVYRENNKQNNMELASALFRHNGGFPQAFTCDGEGSNPPLDIEDVPEDAKSLALVLRDPDAVEGIFIHWIMWNIDPKTEKIDVGTVPEGAVQGATTNKKNHYIPPCPPSGTHRYIFTLYALDTRLDLPFTSNVEQLNAAIDGHVIDKAELLALYR
jgi:hypothetical protein